MSAVTAACLLVRKSTYLAVGGLDEKLQVAFNDIDFCLRVRRAGYKVIQDAHALLYHYESATRGTELKHVDDNDRFAHEYREHHGGADHHVFRGDGGGALALADALGVVFEAAQHRAAHAGFMGAAVGRRHRVAVGGEEAVGVCRPGDRPFAGAVGADPAGFAGEDVGMHQRVGMNGGGEVIL